MTSVRSNCQTNYSHTHSDRTFIFRNMKEIRIDGEDYETFMKLRKQGRTWSENLNIVIEKGFEALRKGVRE